MSKGQWVWARQRGQPKPPESEKTAITAACERFIADVLKPRCLPRIEPTSFNYPLTFTGSGTGTSIGSSNASAPIARMPSLQNLMRRLPGWSTSAGIVLTSLIFGPTPEMPTASAAAFERSMKPIYAQGRSAICPEIPPATGFCRGSAPVTSPKVPQP
jgi:hypothetical protein